MFARRPFPCAPRRDLDIDYRRRRRRRVVRPGRWRNQVRAAAYRARLVCRRVALSPIAWVDALAKFDFLRVVLLWGAQVVCLMVRFAHARVCSSIEVAKVALANASANDRALVPPVLGSVGGVHGEIRSAVEDFSGKNTALSRSLRLSRRPAALPRVRDPLDRLPLLPVPRRPLPDQARKSRRVLQRHRKAVREATVTNALLAGLCELSHSTGPTKRPFYAQASAEDRREVARLQGRVQEYLVRQDRHNAPQTARIAWARLVRELGQGYDGCRRGDIVPLRVDQLALPDVQRRLRLESTARAGDFVRGWRQLMLRHPDDAPAPSLVSSTGSYGDPSLRGTTLVELGLRLLKSGMAVPGHKLLPCGVRMFAVHKRDSEQRLVFDMRRGNLHFQEPPTCEMASIETLAALDLSSAAVGNGALHAFAGDVPDYFYRLQLPDDMVGLFWVDGLEGPAFDEFREAAVQGGYPADKFGDCEALCLVVPCMGFSWAPLLAQLTLEEVLDATPGFDNSQVVRHKGVPPSLTVGVPERSRFHWAYIDDYGGVCVEPTEDRARAAAWQAGADVRAVLESRELNAHKEQVGTALTVLGAEFELDHRRIVPKHSSFTELVLATHYASKEGSKVSAHQLEMVLGKWAWFLLLRRELFCCLNASYHWVQDMRSGAYCKVLHRCWDDVEDPPVGWSPVQDASFHARVRDVRFKPRVLPLGVRRELRLLCRLAPFVTADLSWAWWGELSMVDAGPEGCAVAVAQVGEDFAKAVGSPYLGAGWKQYPDGVRPPPDISIGALDSGVAWRLAFSRTFHDFEHNNVRELWSGLAAVRRLVRNRRCRRRRVVVATDSLVALGVACKGRSSSPPLLLLARRLAAVTLFGELRTVWPYVPSEWNLADAGSRGVYRVGVHYETAAKAASRGRLHISEIRGPGAVAWS